MSYIQIFLVIFIFANINITQPFWGSSNEKYKNLQEVLTSCKRNAGGTWEENCGKELDRFYDKFNTDCPRPTLFAARLGDAEIVESLIRHGAIVESYHANQCIEEILKLKDRNQSTLIHVFLKYLEQSSYTREKLLELAIKEDNGEAIEIFIANGFSIHDKALYMALVDHKPHAARALAKHGAALSAARREGLRISSYTCLDAIDTLLESHRLNTCPSAKKE